MHSRPFKTIAFLVVIASLGALACDLSTFGLGQASKPQIVIQSPVSGAQFREGAEIAVQSVSVDRTGITRVELAVDGATVRADAPPIAQGQTSFTLIQRWQAAPGTHTLSVRAFNASGVASDPAFVSVTITPGVEVPTAGAITPIPPAPTGELPIAPSPSSVLPTLPPVEATVTLTPIPATRAPTRTPTLSAPPGVYAVSIRVDPAAPKRGQFVTFHVTFLNTTGSPQGYRWRIRIFEPDKRNSFGDTAPLNSTLPVGTSVLASEANWRVSGPGDCMQFAARVFWIEPTSKQETEFSKPDGGGPAAGFQVCP